VKTPIFAISSKIKTYRLGLLAAVAAAYTDVL